MRVCDSNKKIYKECYNLTKYGIITDYYIRNGFVKVIRNGSRAIKLQHPDDLYFYFKDYYECNDLYDISN